MPPAFAAAFIAYLRAITPRCRRHHFLSRHCHLLMPFSAPRTPASPHASPHRHRPRLISPLFSIAAIDADDHATPIFAPPRAQAVRRSVTLPQLMICCQLRLIAHYARRRH